MISKLLELLLYWFASFIVFLIIGILIAVLSELTFAELFSFPGVLAMLGLSAGSAFVAAMTSAPERNDEK